MARITIINYRKLCRDISLLHQGIIMLRHYFSMLQHYFSMSGHRFERKINLKLVFVTIIKKTQQIIWPINRRFET